MRDPHACGRRERDRQRDGRPEERRRRIDGRDVDEDARPQRQRANAVRFSQRRLSPAPPAT
jgi:hypothetical protein